MLRTNLATRPFYNERAVHVAIAAAALLVIVITALNGARIITLSRHHTELASRIDSEQAEAARLTKEAATIRRTINRDELEVVARAAAEANALIDQRTFSWTEFFNHIEGTLPPDVMLTAVHPSFDGDVTKVSMGVLARRQEDVDELMERLDATGAFAQVIPAQQVTTDEGLYRVTIESVYTGTVPEAEKPAAPAKPSGPGGRP